MRKSGSVWVSLATVAFVVGCGAPPLADERDEELGSIQAALDASCSVTLDYLNYYLEPGGPLWVDAYAWPVCADGSSLERRYLITNPKNQVTTTAWSEYPPTPVELAAGSPEGTYTVTVEVRRTGDTTVVAKASQKMVVGRSCTWVSVNSQPSSEAPLGTQVLVEPYLICSDLPYEWRLTVKKPGGGSVNYPWQQGPSVNWDTTGLNAGVGTLQVSARNVGNTVVDVTASRTFTVGSVCHAASLGSSGSGASRTLSSTASCWNGGTPLYRYSVTAPNGTVSELRGFDASPQFDWDVTGLDGTYTAKVEVRAEQSPEQLPTAKTLKVPLGSPCTTVTLPELWGSYPRSQGLSVTATAPCSNAEFHFQRRVPSTTTWTTVCPYSSSATCDLDIANQPLGDYVVRVLVRKIGSIASYDAASAQRELVVTDGIPLLRTFFTAHTYNPSALSADGRWVLATTHRWSRSSGFTTLDRPDDSPTNYQEGGAMDLSDSGSVIVGSDIASNGQTAPTRGSAGAMSWLAPNQFFYSAQANATNASGSVVVGYVNEAGGQQAFRWTSAGLVRLGDLPGGYVVSDARDVSGDGTVVVGLGAAGDHNEGFRWTSATGMVSLGLFAGDAWSGAYGISRDGQVIIGQGGPGNHALRWSAATGWVPLGTPAGFNGALPAAVSANGSVIFGTATSSAGPAPFIWSAATGPRLLADLLSENGIDLTGWALETAIDMSSDGKTLLGAGYAPGTGYTGWLVTLP